MHVIIVDDNTDYLSEFKLLLSDIGFTVSSFCNPHDAIQHFAENPCNIIVSDLMMPEMNGDVMMQYILSLNRDTVFIINTGHEDEYVVKSLKSRGAYSVLNKSLSYDEKISYFKELHSHFGKH